MSNVSVQTKKIIEKSKIYFDGMTHRAALTLQESLLTLKVADNAVIYPQLENPGYWGVCWMASPLHEAKPENTRELIERIFYKAAIQFECHRFIPNPDYPGVWNTVCHYPEGLSGKPERHPNYETTEHRCDCQHGQILQAKFGTNIACKHRVNLLMRKRNGTLLLHPLTPTSAPETREERRARIQSDIDKDFA